MSTTAKNIANLCTNVLKICYGYVISSMGLIAEMSYKDIPDCFQPLSIANNKYTFSDGVYSLERDRRITMNRLFPVAAEQMPLVLTMPLVAEDSETPQGQTPVYLNGVRRVRNVCVDCDFHLRSSSGSYTCEWILDVIVIRQGQTQAFASDVLATRCGTSRYGSTQLPDLETFSLCYPGYVDLNGGDQVIVRFSVATPDGGGFYYTGTLNASALVRFG